MCSPNFQRFNPLQKVRRYIICDLDGTLSDYRHRLHFIKGKAPDWNAFNDEAEFDHVIKPTAEVLRLTRNEPEYAVAIVTARPQNYLHATLNWLRENDIPYNIVLMRKPGDYRSDVEVKMDMYQEYFADKTVIFAMEDRDKVVEMYRSLGITCFQVQKGAY